MNFKKLFSLFFVSLIFILLASRIFGEWDQIKFHILNLNVINLILTMIIALPIYFFNVLTWHLITKTVGIKIAFKKNLRLWLISNAARFLPGGFWQYPSRIYLLGQHGVSKVEATTAVLLEAIFNLATGALIIMIFFLSTPSIIPVDKLIWMLAILAMIPLFIYIFGKLEVSKKFKILKSLKISLRVVPFLFLTIFMQYFFAGLTLLILANSIANLPMTFLFIFIGIFTTSWILGYLTVFAPSGLGVQEASIATLLSSYIPFGIAGIIAIIFRVVLLLVEVFVLGFVLLILDKLLDSSFEGRYNH